jgi:hypothetical protein
MKNEEISNIQHSTSNIEDEDGDDDEDEDEDEDGDEVEDGR